MCLQLFYYGFKRNKNKTKQEVSIKGLENTTFG